MSQVWVATHPRTVCSSPFCDKVCLIAQYFLVRQLEHESASCRTGSHDGHAKVQSSFQGRRSCNRFLKERRQRERQAAGKWADCALEVNIHCGELLPKVGGHSVCALRRRQDLGAEEAEVPALTTNHRSLKGSWEKQDQRSWKQRWSVVTRRERVNEARRRVVLERAD